MMNYLMYLAIGFVLGCLFALAVIFLVITLTLNNMKKEAKVWYDINGNKRW